MVPVLAFRWSHKLIPCHCPSSKSPKQIEDDTHADSLGQYASPWWSWFFRRGSRCRKFINGHHRGRRQRGGWVSSCLTSGIALLHINSSTMDIVDNEEEDGWGLSAGCWKCWLTSFSYVMLDITDEENDGWAWLTGSRGCSLISFSYDMLNIADVEGNERWGWPAECSNLLAHEFQLCHFDYVRHFVFDGESEHLLKYIAWCGPW